MTKYTFLWCAENGEGQSGKCIISIIICYSEASKENEITQVTGKSVLDRSEKVKSRSLEIPSNAIFHMSVSVGYQQEQLVLFYFFRMEVK